VVASLALIPIAAEVDALVTTIALAAVALGVALSGVGRTGDETAADAPGRAA
jgi:hypothetical protein